MEGHVEALEVGEDPAAQVEQHPLADPAGALQEDDPAGRLEHHDAEQRAEHLQERPGAATGQQRRHTGVDADLHQARHRQAGGVLRDDHDAQQQDHPPVRREQVTQQPPAAAAQAQPDVVGEVVGVLRGDAAPGAAGPRAAGLVGLVRPRAPSGRGTTTGGVRASAGRRARAHRAASASSSSAASRWR